MFEANYIYIYNALSAYDRKKNRVEAFRVKRISWSNVSFVENTIFFAAKYASYKRESLCWTNDIKVYGTEIVC